MWSEEGGGHIGMLEHRWSGSAAQGDLVTYFPAAGHKDSLVLCVLIQTAIVIWLSTIICQFPPILFCQFPSLQDGQYPKTI